MIKTSKAKIIKTSLLANNDRTRLANILLVTALTHSEDTKKHCSHLESCSWPPLLAQLYFGLHLLFKIQRDLKGFEFV